MKLVRPAWLVRSIAACSPLLAVAILASSSTPACTIGSTCDCADGTILVEVPLDKASLTDRVALSGAACAGTTASCLQNVTAGCIEYAVTPVSSGACNIAVALFDHTYSTSVNVKRGTGCCSGLYPDPLGSGTVNVSSERPTLRTP